MTVINLLIFLMAAIGMTNIILYGNFPIVKGIRTKALNSQSDFWKELFSCHMCMGFWCGLATALLLFPAGWLTFPLACASSFANVFNVNVQTWIEANSMVDLGGSDG